MAAVTQIIQDDIIGFIASMGAVKDETSDLFKYYFSSGANSLFSGLATDGTAATVTSKLTKAEVINGITMVGELVDFFDNAAVAQADYLATAHNLINGTTAAGSALSADAENIGDRLKSLGGTLISNFKTAKDILNYYSSNQINLAIANLDNDRVIFGSDMTKAELAAAIVLVEQMKKLLNNEAVTTGDYKVTLGLWLRLTAS